MNEIKKTILHPDNQPDTDLYPKTSADQIDGLKEFVEQYSSDSIKVSITVPAGAASGTLTEEQLATLQASEANYIEMVNDKELYYLNDNGHVDGYLTYSHIGIENSKATIKTLTITVSAKSFVVVTTVVPTDAGGGKLYRHDIKIFHSNHYQNFILTTFNNSNVELNTLELLKANLPEYSMCTMASTSSAEYGAMTFYIANSKVFILGVYYGYYAKEIAALDPDRDGFIPYSITDIVTEV